MWFNIFYLFIALFIVATIILYIVKPSWVKTNNCVTGKCNVDFVLVIITAFILSMLITILAIGITQSVVESKYNKIKNDAQEYIREAKDEVQDISNLIRTEFTKIQQEAGVLRTDIQNIGNTLSQNAGLRTIANNLNQDLAPLVQGAQNSLRSVARRLTPRKQLF